MRMMAAARQHGASMIEVLVSIIVVSLGIVALAGLIMTATRLSKASEMRAIASLLAGDIADRMRANICGVTGQYTYQPVAGGTAIARCASFPAGTSYQLTAAFTKLSAAPADAAKDCAVTGVTCTPAEMAAYDRAQWQQALYYGLPNGTGYISYDAGAVAAGGAVDVWVAWLDPTALSVGDFASLDAENALTCPPGFRDLDPQPRCMYFRVAL